MSTTSSCLCNRNCEHRCVPFFACTHKAQHVHHTNFYFHSENKTIIRAHPMLYSVKIGLFFFILVSDGYKRFGQSPINCFILLRLGEKCYNRFSSFCLFSLFYFFNIRSAFLVPSSRIETSLVLRKSQQAALHHQQLIAFANIVKHYNNVLQLMLLSFALHMYTQRNVFFSSLFYKL